MSSTKSFSTFIYDILTLFGITLLYIILTAFFQGGTCLALGIPFSTDLNNDIGPEKRLVIEAISLIAPVLLFLIFRKRLWFGLDYFRLPQNNGALFLKAFLFSFLLIGLTSAAILYFYDVGLAFNSSFNIGNLLFYFLFFTIAAFNEELLCRILYLEIMVLYNKWIALITGSVLFTALHLFNPHISLLGAINIFLAGIQLGQIYFYYRRNIFFVTIFHMGWNFFQGSVFGFAVSGISVSGSLFTLRIPEGSLWSKANFGLEGSVPCTVVLILSIIVIEFFDYKEMKKIELESAEGILIYEEETVED